MLVRSQRSSRPLAPHSAFEASTGPLSTAARQVYASIDGGIQGCHVRPTAVDGNPMSDDQLPATPCQHDTAVQWPWALEWGCTKRRRGGQVVVSQIHGKIGRGRSPSSRHLRGYIGVHSPESRRAVWRAALDLLMAKHGRVHDIGRGRSLRRQGLDSSPVGLHAALRRSVSK